MLSRASNNSPRGIWSDGDVMYVADESDDRVYSYNMPDAIDARLASLTLSGVDIGEFDPARTDYEGSVGEGVTETVVTAEAMQRRTDVTIDPPDADGNEANGHQVALPDLGEITVTVTSQDGSRSKTYRVRFPETGWDPARDPGHIACAAPSPRGSASLSTRAAASRSWSPARRAGASWPSTPCTTARTSPTSSGRQTS